MTAIVAERTELESSTSNSTSSADGAPTTAATGKGGAITFDVFEWAFDVQPEGPNAFYIYTYLMQCLKRSGPVNLA